MRDKGLSTRFRAVLAILTVTLHLTSAWAANHEKVPHTLNSEVADWKPGSDPILVGVGKLNFAPSGSWTEEVLHSFASYPDGDGPYAGVIFNAAGNLFGTTVDSLDYRCGTVFGLTPAGGGTWGESVLYNFSCEDGTYPEGSLIIDAADDLYGTTYLGGASGYGTVFELTPTPFGGWTGKVLHSFQNNGVDGYYPYSSLIFDAAGDLYGTAYAGGSYGVGMVFELTPEAGGSWTESVLHSFIFNGTDGAYPTAGLVFDASGDLYGTTYYGGTNGAGTVFELISEGGGRWTKKILHNFNFNGTDGGYPQAGLIFDRSGNLYGTTYAGGTHDFGTVFELMPESGGSWTESVLHSFNENGTDGAYPVAALTLDASGDLYGTTYAGGASGYGTVFELTPEGGGRWTETVLHSFNNNGTDGADPYAGLIFDRSGNLYGTTVAGGTHGYGTVFELKHSAFGQAGH